MVYFPAGIEVNVRISSANAAASSAECITATDAASAVRRFISSAHMNAVSRSSDANGSSKR